METPKIAQNASNRVFDFSRVPEHAIQRRLNYIMLDLLQLAPKLDPEATELELDAIMTELQSRLGATS